jgi:hypothetical protein
MAAKLTLYHQMGCFICTQKFQGPDKTCRKATVTPLAA